VVSCGPYVAIIAVPDREQVALSVWNPERSQDTTHVDIGAAEQSGEYHYDDDAQGSE
jgi:hypothetical protein